MIRHAGTEAISGPAVRPRSWHWPLAAIFLLAFALRLYAVVHFPATPVSDAADYHSLAVRLALGRGYVTSVGAPTAWRPPAYPVFLAGLYKLFGADPGVACFAQALLGSLSVVLLIEFGLPVVGWRAALLAGWLAAIYPSLVWLPRVLLSENLVLPLTLAALLTATTLLRTRSVVRAVALGMLLGLSVLVRGASGFVALAVVIGLVAALRRQRASWIGWVLPSVVLVSMAMVLAPWMLRNCALFHRGMLLSTQDGLALYASYWPAHVGPKLLWGNLPGAEDPSVALAFRAGDEAEVSSSLRQLTARRLRAQPSRFFRLILAKLLSLAAPFDWEWFPRPSGSSRSTNIGYILILLPALVGVRVLTQRPAPNQWLLWVLPVSVLAQAVIFYGSPRFRLPAETTGLLLAALGATWIVDPARTLHFE